jgi:hypothetical protein
VHHILPLTTIVRERVLPIKGAVLARLGQRVGPADIVAEATWAREHIFLDVARILNISADAADRLIRCRAGDELLAGAVVARSRGLVPKIIKSPRKARVVAAGGGQVLLESGESRLELRAGISGNVTRIIADRGVEIQTSGALVQGVWGNGRVDTGVMINLADKPDTVLSAGRLDEHALDPDRWRGGCGGAAVQANHRAADPGSLFLVADTDRARGTPSDRRHGGSILPELHRASLDHDQRSETIPNADAFDRCQRRAPEIIPLP